MPRKNSTSWSVGNPVTSARLNQFNSDIDDLYSTWSDRLKAYQLAGDGLLVRIGAGAYRVWSNEGIYAGGTVTVADDTTTYIMFKNDGTIQTSTVTWVADYARICRAVASAWVVTLIQDKPDLLGGLLGGSAGFSNITSTTYTKGLLTAFTADAINYTITYEWTGFNWRRMKTISNSTNTWTISYTWRFISWISKT